MIWATDLSVIQWLTLLALCVMAGLDRTALAQSMLCRPIVSGCLCGFIMGNYAAGLMLGAGMELLWLMRLPVGATVAPDDTQSTIAAVFLFCGLSPQISEVLPESVLMLTLLFFAAAFSHLGRFIDIGVRHLNGRLQRQAQNKLDQLGATEVTQVLGWLNAAGLINFAVGSLFSQAIILCATMASVVFTLPILSSLPWQTPDLVIYAAVFVGVSAVYASMAVRYSIVLFGAGFGATLLLTMV